MSSLSQITHNVYIVQRNPSGQNPLGFSITYSCNLL
ncbi:tail fiber protein [Escherichia phage TrudiRoth]|uniref:Tail fiber protein n=1 Tax=Escherichia phage TrudiRoth TaxID=2851994 RepID=A0AAE7W1B8_9CAUD|nr:tail fiber protein [Escherichia phage TrudiRoth]